MLAYYCMFLVGLLQISPFGLGVLATKLKGSRDADQTIAAARLSGPNARRIASTVWRDDPKMRGVGGEGFFSCLYVIFVQSSKGAQRRRNKQLPHKVQRHIRWTRRKMESDCRGVTDVRSAGIKLFPTLHGLAAICHFSMARRRCRVQLLRLLSRPPYSLQWPIISTAGETNGRKDWLRAPVKGGHKDMPWMGNQGLGQQEGGERAGNEAFASPDHSSEEARHVGSLKGLQFATFGFG
ncbi:hypothetical protein FN846DRAFT_189690 [Sphaerosporella brunnea]|uniref:Uncharacterized protein n=1 Tax=Sphaerosporella brunnea TaxID=1250544 RepID=A0A5J5ENL3_9PEZI|nr:hypothetical protein FN846DRAFT_189690 [Sphaerosporella brunnea]